MAFAQGSLGPPIFVVGAPRSGTTLLASMLASHSEVAGGVETHFFSKLSTARLSEALSDGAWPAKALHALETLTLADQSVPDLFGLSRSEMHDYLCAGDQTIQTMLGALVVLHARRLGKPRWVEKTPNHLLHVGAIRESIPGSKIVRIVRDPRDVSRSMTVLPWACRSALGNAMIWADWHERSAGDFGPDYGDTITVHYHELVAAPREVLDRLCTFLELDFETGMLDFADAARVMSSTNEPWKESTAHQLDTARGGNWRESKQNPDAVAVALTCAAGLRDFGFEPGVVPTRVEYCYPFAPLRVDSFVARRLATGLAGVALRLTSQPRHVDGRLTLLMPNSVWSEPKDTLRLLSLWLRRLIKGRRTTIFRAGGHT